MYNMSNRCLYNTTFRQLIDTAPEEILGTLHLNYHGDALTTTDDAWIGEITLLQQAPPSRSRYRLSAHL